MSRSIPVAKSDVIYVRILGYSDRILICKIVVHTYLVTKLPVVIETLVP